MFKDSVKEDHWYFFAVTGINISQKILRSLIKGEFDEGILRSFEEINQKGESTSILALMDYFYFDIFKQFNNKWVNSRVNIMEFNHFFERVYDSDFLPFYEHSIK